MERPHRQLRAGLADRLGGDDADRLADVDHVPAGQVAAVAEHADAAPGLAGEHRADLDVVDARVLDDADLLLGDLLAGRDQHLAGVRVEDVVDGDAAEDAVARASR